MPTNVFDGHVDVFLSTYGQQFRNPGLIADSVAPRVAVPRQADKYYVGSEDGLSDDVDDERGPASPARTVQLTTSEDKYMCPDHSRAHMIPVEDIPKPGVPSRRQRATRTLTDLILLAHEIRTAGIATTAANYSAGQKVALTGNDQWSAVHADSDPIEDVEVGKEAIAKAIGFDPNVMILGREVLTQLKKHADIKGALRTDMTKVVTARDLEDLFEMRILVGRARKKSAAGAKSFVWGKHAILAYVDPNPSMEDVSFMKTFVWTEAPDTVGGFQTLIGRISPPSAKAEELSVHFYHDEKQTVKDAAYLIENAAA